ncbi:MAG: ATP synthase F1 subunit gamma [Deltaproteobacteria bacterium]|nr:ATP synthase F1 subunit gamma [Deltaproteobacteria bacterium]
MATLKDIRKRIGSVQNSQKITKAMKMVAAAKLRRSQNALVQARPYEKNISEVLKRVAEQLPENASPYLEMKEAAGLPVRLIVFNSDRGLCGGFNSNLLRKVLFFLNTDAKNFPKVDLTVLGKKGRDFFRARKMIIDQELPGSSEKPEFSKSLELAQQLLQDYQDQKFGALYIAYNSFKSAISQEVRIRKVLPFDLPEASSTEEQLPVIYEPSLMALFDQLVPRYVASQMHMAMLESVASEMGARMSAMENATNNAKEMIGILTLQYNRARQAMITKELMDIVNGAEALK